MSLCPFATFDKMHELSLACELVDLACEVAAREGASRVEAIELEVGLLSGVMAEALLFGFETACRGTAAEGAEVELFPEPGRGFCRRCGQAFPLETFLVRCPHCESPGLEVSGGDSLRLRAVRVT